MDAKSGNVTSDQGDFLMGCGFLVFIVIFVIPTMIALSVLWINWLVGLCLGK